MFKIALLKRQKQIMFLDNADDVNMEERKLCRCESVVGLVGGFATPGGKMREASLLQVLPTT